MLIRSKWTSASASCSRRSPSSRAASRSPSSVSALRPEVEPREPHDTAAARDEAAAGSEQGVGRGDLEREAPAEHPAARSHAQPQADAVSAHDRLERLRIGLGLEPATREDRDVLPERPCRERPRAAAHQARVTRTGIRLSAFVKFERTRSAGPVSSRSASRGSSSSKSTCTSSFARCAPRQ